MTLLPEMGPVNWGRRFLSAFRNVFNRQKLGEAFYHTGDRQVVSAPTSPTTIVGNYPRVSAGTRGAAGGPIVARAPRANSYHLDPLTPHTQPTVAHSIMAQ